MFIICARGVATRPVAEQREQLLPPPSFRLPALPIESPSELLAAIFSHHRAVAMTDLDSVFYYRVPRGWLSRDARAQLARVIEQLRLGVVKGAMRLPGVTKAWISPDGLSFTLTGPDWSPELSHAAAALSIRLQRRIAPNWEVQIEGGFHEGLDNMENHTLVYERRGSRARTVKTRT